MLTNTKSKDLTLSGYAKVRALYVRLKAAGKPDKVARVAADEKITAHSFCHL
jgi:hypothetical protein